MSRTERVIRIAGREFGEHFGCCAAIQAIEIHVGEARERLRKLERDVAWLEAQRQRREAQLAVGMWPLPRGHEPAGFATPTTTPGDPT